jgi:hypothetical protein
VVFLLLQPIGEAAVSVISSRRWSSPVAAAAEGNEGSADKMPACCRPARYGESAIRFRLKL